MTDSTERYFDHVPPTIGDHFIMNLYAAIYRLIYMVYRLGKTDDTSLEQAFERYPFLVD